MSRKNNDLLKSRHKKIGRFYRRAAFIVLVCILFTTTALADDDALATINNLSDFIFSAVRALGVIILTWGVVQIGMSLQSHDPSQRTNGFLSFFGGLVIALSKSILTAIGVI